MYLTKIFFLGVFMQTSWGLEDEPKCYSKFDWQEKLLEKTIKTELQMQEYIRNMNEAMSNIAVFKEEMKNMRDSLEAEIEDYKSIINKQNQLIADRVQEPIVVFNVKKAKDVSPQEHQKILFNTILLNLGGAYDEATGIFTAPVNGTYMFAIQVATKVGNWGRFHLVCDTSNNIILSIAHYNADASHTSTAGAVAHILTKGQRIWLEFAYNSGTTQVLYDHVNYASNRFSGMLVRQTLN